MSQRELDTERAWEDPTPPKFWREGSGPPKLSARFVSAVRSILFVYLLGLIMAIGAERIFWFWSPSLGVQLEIAAWYGLATAAGHMLMHRFHVTDWWSLMLVLPVIAFVVEGAITPVIYSGGPLVPVFPAWFSFWHGMFAFAGLVFLFRRWLLDEALLRLTAGSIGLGVFWALWSSTLWLPENVNDPELIEGAGGPLEILEPLAFTRYTVTMTAVFISGHALIGFVWPTASNGVVGRSGSLSWSERGVLGLTLAGVTTWTFVFPWALPMFGLYCWVQLKGLRWHRSAVSAGTPSFVDGLSGRVSWRALLPVILIAPTAALGYTALWAIEPSDEAVRFFMYATIAVQGVTGFIVAVMALRRARESRNVTSSLASTT